MIRECQSAISFQWVFPRWVYVAVSAFGMGVKCISGAKMCVWPVMWYAVPELLKMMMMTMLIRRYWYAKVNLLCHKATQGTCALLTAGTQEVKMMLRESHSLLLSLEYTFAHWIVHKKLCSVYTHRVLEDKKNTSMNIKCKSRHILFCSLMFIFMSLMWLPLPLYFAARCHFLVCQKFPSREHMIPYGQKAKAFLAKIKIPELGVEYDSSAAVSTSFSQGRNLMCFPIVFVSDLSK